MTGTFGGLGAEARAMAKTRANPEWTRCLTGRYLSFQVMTAHPFLHPLAPADLQQDMHRPRIREAPAFP